MKYARPDAFCIIMNNNDAHFRVPTLPFPRTVRGLPMGFPPAVPGLSTGCPRTARGMSSFCSWAARELSTSRIRAVLGLPVSFPWAARRLPAVACSLTTVIPLLARNVSGSLGSPSSIARYRSLGWLSLLLKQQIERVFRHLFVFSIAVYP